MLGCLKEGEDALPRDLRLDPLTLPLISGELFENSNPPLNVLDRSRDRSLELADLVLHLKDAGIGPEAHRRESILEFGISRKHNDMDHGIFLTNDPEEIDPCHLGHHDVGDHDVEALLLKQFERILPALCRFNLVTEPTESKDEHIENKRLIVND